MMVDGITIIKLVLFECELLGDVLLIVITLLSAYLLFAYKSQKLPFYVILNDDQV